MDHPHDNVETSTIHLMAVANRDLQTRWFAPGYWRGFILVALILGLGWINLSRLPANVSSADRSTEAPVEGFLAPDFVLASTDGEQVRLSSLRGQPVVLNFWATWCPPCRAEMPALEELWRRSTSDATSDGVIVLGVNQGERAEIVERFARGTVNTTFPLLLDTEQAVGKRYGVRALPTTFFVDADGRIQEIKIGGPLNLATLLDSVGKTTRR